MSFKRSSSDSDRQDYYYDIRIPRKKHCYRGQFEENDCLKNSSSLISISNKEKLKNNELDKNEKCQDIKESSKYDGCHNRNAEKKSISISKVCKINEEIEETIMNVHHSHKNNEQSNSREIRKLNKSRARKDKSKRDRSPKDCKLRKGIDTKEREPETSNEPCDYDTDNLNNSSDTNDGVLRKKLLKQSSLKQHDDKSQETLSKIGRNLDPMKMKKSRHRLVKGTSVNPGEDGDNEDTDGFMGNRLHEDTDVDIPFRDGYDHYKMRSKFESNSSGESGSDHEYLEGDDRYSQLDSSDSSDSYGSSISSSRNPKKIRQKQQTSIDIHVLDNLEFSPVSDKELFSDIDCRPLYFPAVQGCRLVEEFECLNKIEEGTYGVVFRARDRKSNEIVALKRLKMEKERDGFPITSLREINTLMKARHINVVTVREIVVGCNMDKIYLVMDFIEHDLRSLMMSMVKPFEICEVKCLMLQLLTAVAHLHDNWILHRDLKTANLLLSHKGVLKVADFGLAREYGSPLKNYTRVVVTLWYRAPELLLGTKVYSTQIDLWSVGCILGELLQMSALFPGKSEMDQINLLFRELGTPNDKIWPGFSNLANVKRFEFGKYENNLLGKKLGKNLSATGLDLINKLLTYCPNKRISAEDALKHRYFDETPVAISQDLFPIRPAKSEGGLITRLNMTQCPRAPCGGGGQGAKCLQDDRLPAGY